MLAAIDVQYCDEKAAAACVAFDDWTDAAPADRKTTIIDSVAPYVPGRFFERELPCLLAALNAFDITFDAIVIDGYVWLARERPGLGSHLFEELGAEVPVIGVAKTAFKDNDVAIPIRRGASAMPLYITAAGLDPEVAAHHVTSMHGPHRTPTLLKCVDRLCRSAADAL